MDSPKQAPPPPFPIERASTFRSIEVALEEAIARTRDGHVIDDDHAPRCGPGERRTGSPLI